MSTNASHLSQIERNKSLVADYYAQVWNDKDIAALSRFVANDYLQHNPQLANGRAAMETFLTGFFQKLPDAHFTIARLVADGDLVIAHCLFKANEADRGMAVVDVFRIAEGILVEHWDVKEAVPESTVNGNPMV